MFTGIIQNLGEIISFENGNLIIKVKNFDENSIKIGESIALDGCCLSVTSIEHDILRFFVSGETISKTIISKYKVGNFVNLEKPITITDKLGGHWVLGHVDCVSHIETIEKSEGAWEVFINLPANFKKYVVYKGSIAVSGISLTINEILENSIRLTIIPITIEKTSFSNLTKGSFVNLEFDILAKYTESLIKYGK